MEGRILGRILTVVKDRVRWRNGEGLGDLEERGDALNPRCPEEINDSHTAIFFSHRNRNMRGSDVNAAACLAE